MSREVKRVPLDFDWPLKKVWEGFRQPDSLQGTKCPDCEGGQTHAGWWIQNFAQRIGMLASDIHDQRTGRHMHPWLTNDPYPHGHFENNRFVVDRPSEDIVDLLVKLSDYVGHPQTAERLLSPFKGADYTVMRALAKAAGDEDIFICKTCHGEGQLEDYPGQFAERDAWEHSEPPTGEGWQLWETTSEGSPITRVFATKEELEDSLRHEGDINGQTYAQAYLDQLFEMNWMPTFLATPKED
jgi:hypothetical protein